MKNKKIGWDKINNCGKCEWLILQQNIECKFINMCLLHTKEVQKLNSCDNFMRKSGYHYTQ